MTGLTDQERAAFLALAMRRPRLSDPEADLAGFEPTPERRLAYIRFATTASQFLRGEKEIGFRGDDWRL